MLPTPGVLTSLISPPSRPRDFAADRQAQARATVLAAGRAIGLLECLEDNLLLFGGDADAGIADGEGHDCLCPAEHG